MLKYFLDATLPVSSVDPLAVHTHRKEAISKGYTTALVKLGAKFVNMFFCNMGGCVSCGACSRRLKVFTNIADLPNISPNGGKQNGRRPQSLCKQDLWQPDHTLS